MLDQPTTKEILKNIPKGIPYSMSGIQAFVSENITLDNADLELYTSTRKTNYKHWQNVVQKTVFHLKENGSIQYPSEDCYIF